PDGHREFLDADAVISSIPLSLLTINMDPKPPAEIIQAAKSLKFRDLITINIMLDRKQVTPDTWLYIHDLEIPFARLHEPRNWSPDMAPPGKTSIVAELFCSIGDEIWRKSDEELCNLVIHHLAESLKFIRKGEVLASFAFRAPGAYPIYDLSYRTNLQLIKEHIATIRNLQIIGRGGTFRYNNSDHSIEMGLMAAKNLLGGKYRIDSVNEEQEYLEEKREDNLAEAR
ncbi:MAG TPA: FAD-dependent oxidoreductase, partial [Acidobacteriota bacterium]|nr:FAD-dependent oxidoreductase [Acidobacteriota bacterium]